MGIFVRRFNFRIARADLFEFNIVSDLALISRKERLVGPLQYEATHILCVPWHICNIHDSLFLFAGPLFQSCMKATGTAI